VYRSRAGYEPTAKFTTWLYRIATHLALNSLRDGKNERGQESLDERDSGMPARQAADGQPFGRAVDGAGDGVRGSAPRGGGAAAKQRAAVLMHKYEEMEYSQIAKVLECSESAVKSLLFRAYESLRARLATWRESEEV